MYPEEKNAQIFEFLLNHIKNDSINIFEDNENTAAYLILYFLKEYAKVSQILGGLLSLIDDTVKKNSNTYNIL